MDPRDVRLHRFVALAIGVGTLVIGVLAGPAAAVMAGVGWIIPVLLLSAGDHRYYGRVARRDLPVTGDPGIDG